MSCPSQQRSPKTSRRARHLANYLAIAVLFAGALATAHGNTGGWYFNSFTANDATQGLTPEQAKARCFDACHKAQEARAFVFSDPRR